MPPTRVRREKAIWSGILYYFPLALSSTARQLMMYPQLSHPCPTRLPKQILPATMPAAGVEAGFDQLHARRRQDAQDPSGAISRGHEVYNDNITSMNLALRFKRRFYCLYPVYLYSSCLRDSRPLLFRTRKQVTSHAMSAHLTAHVLQGLGDSPGVLFGQLIGVIHEAGHTVPLLVVRIDRLVHDVLAGGAAAGRIALATMTVALGVDP